MRSPTTPTTPTTTLEGVLGAEGGTVVVDARTDLDAPFYGYCADTGDALRFPNPWALDITVLA